jgi:hypothetical protein
MSPRQKTCAGLALLLCAVVALVIQRAGKSSTGDGSTRAVSSVDNATAKPGPARPAPLAGWDRLIEVMAHGGAPAEVSEATGFLDELMRSHVSLEAGRREELLAALERGSPSGMGEGDWSHLFNNACNLLAVGQTAADERVLVLLERTAAEDSRLVMRLYALQHLGESYEHAGDDAKKRLRELVRKMLTQPDAPTAGTALVLWRKWEGSVEGEGDSSNDISRAIVTDTTRPVDVRVSALHAIGDDPKVLDLARGIAPDRSQPVVLRKAAISLIGRHGQEKDLPVLRECGRESPRLSQAGVPAIRMLEDRIAGKPEPVPTSY